MNRFLLDPSHRTFFRESLQNNVCQAERQTYSALLSAKKINEFPGFLIFFNRCAVVQSTF